MIESTVQGIPCLIDVTHFKVVPPHRGSAWSCDSDLDYYGYEELEYVICDRRGRPAAWLERKVTDTDRDNIRQDIEKHYSN